MKGTSQKERKKSMIDTRYGGDSFCCDVKIDIVLANICNTQRRFSQILDLSLENYTYFLIELKCEANSEVGNLIA